MKEVADFASALYYASKAFQMYTGEHPRTLDALNALEQSTNTLLASRDRVSVLTSKGKLLLDGKPVEPQTVQFGMLAKQIEERGFGGFTLVHGMTARDLRELVRIFAVTPQTVQGAGGAEQMLTRAGALHVRISKVRYEALTEGEEVVWRSSRRGGGDDELSTAHDLPTLLRRVLLRAVHAEAKAAADGAPDPAADADLADASEFLATAMPADEEGKAAAPELLRKALAGLQPEIQLALLVSIGRVPSTSLRNALGPAARDLVGEGGGGEGTGGGAGEGGSGTSLVSMLGGVTAPDLLARLFEALPEEDRSLDLLRDRLADLGISREQLDEILDVVGWEKLTTDQKIEKLLARDRIFDFPPEKLRLFVRDLLADGRTEDVLRLIEKFARGLKYESLQIRKSVYDTLGQIAGFVRDRGGNAEVESALAKVLLNAFIRESDERMLDVAADAVTNLEMIYVATGRADLALRDITRLTAALAASAETNPLAKAASDSVFRALGEKERLAVIVAQICESDAETLSRAVLPFVDFVGRVVAGAVIDAMAHEEDRNRRGRLVRTLKTIGEPAHPFLLESLESPIWYVVRNALNILGDIGSPVFAEAVGRRLKHGDARVRRSAARALGKFGGPEAEALLVAAIADPDAETQREILLCVGAIKAQSALPAIIELARPRRFGATDDAMRELAVTTLGQIASPASIPFLSDIVRRKGAFGRDSLQIRVAAAKALAGIGTPEARDTLRNAIGSESDSAARETLTRATDGLRARPT